MSQPWMTVRDALYRVQQARQDLQQAWDGWGKCPGGADDATALGMIAVQTAVGELCLRLERQAAAFDAAQAAAQEVLG